MIGFLLPKFAWLALLALSPIAIHLLNRLRLQRIDFSSLQFLREVRRERFNWLRLKELLLLIVRTAVLLFLFLGLSRPFVRLDRPGTRREVSTVLILDDSYSMRYGTTWERALDAARNYLNQLTATSEAAILTTTTQISGLSRNRQQLMTALDSLTAGWQAHDLSWALERAPQLLADALLPRQEIVIFTDLQQRSLAPLIRNRNLPATIFVRDCGTQDWKNCAVTGVTFREPLPEPQRPTRLVARIRNYGTQAENRTLTLQSSGTVETQPVRIPPNSETRVEFEKEFSQPGQHTGTVSLDQDSLPCDDQYFFALSIPRRLPVLLIGDDPNDVHYLARALAPDSEGFFAVTVRNSPGLKAADLNQFKVIGIANPARLTLLDWQRIEQYLRQGGGVFIALAREPAEEGFLARYGRISTGVRTSGFVTVSRVNYQHPIFQVFEHRADVSIPRFFSHVRFEPINADVLSSFSDGSPYLLESRTERMIIATCDFNPSRTDLVFRALFVPLLHRIFTYLGQEPFTRNYPVGDTITVPAPPVGLLRVRTPEGEFNIAAASEERSDRRSVKFRDTRVPGIYQLGADNFAVNVRSEEGDLTRFAESDLSRNGITILKDHAPATNDLTQLLLTLAALFLIAEILLLVL